MFYHQTMSDIFDNSFVEVSIQDLESMDNVLYDENSITRKHFPGLDNVVDIKRPTIMKSSNVDGNVVADKFVDGYLHNFTHCSNESFEELFGGLPDLTMSSIESANVNRLC
ncbi:hypothetical protein Hdeb2414_s0025g00663691 [Helianthus debilis subsp. tardiflorus]